MLKLLFGLFSVIFVMGLAMFTIDLVISNIMKKASRGKVSEGRCMLSVFFVLVGSIALTFPLIDVIFDSILK